MNRALRTHREWVAETKRLLRGRTRSVAPIAAVQRLVDRVERATRVGISDWHLVQSWHLLSLEQARVGHHRAAAATLGRLVEHHHALLVEHRRACVAGAAAAAMELARAGETEAARRMLRRATQIGRGLKPPEYLVKEASAVVRARPKKKSR